MIDVSSPAPFVNAALLARYAGKTVRLVGKVGGEGAVTAADGQQVQVKGSGSYPCAFVEIEGVVDGPTTIREIKATPFGNNFDMDSHNELCKLSNNEHSALFL